MTTSTPRRATLATLVSALALASAPALAQTSTDSTSGSMTSGSMSGQGGADITCAELTAMDTAVVPGTLYYVAGYNRGQQDSMGGMQSGDSMTGGTTGTTSGGTAGTGTAGTGTTGTGTSTDSTTSGSTTSGSTTSGSTTSGTTGTGMSDGSGTGGTAQIGRISGFFEIPVEAVMRVCGETPERNVSDVVDEQRGMSGGSTAN